MKRSYLRFDTLAYMLSLANIHPGQKVMVFDDCMGIVVGSIMERLGGYGLVFAVNNHDNRIPCYDCVNRLNFNVVADRNEYQIDAENKYEEPSFSLEQRELTLADYTANIRNTLLIWHLSDLLQIEPIDHASQTVPDDSPLPLPLPLPAPRTIHLPTKMFHTKTDLPMVHKDGTPLRDAELIAIYKKRLDRLQRERWQPSLEEQRAMLRRGMNSLVVASNNPLEEVPLLLPYLQPSGILVVYSQYQALLAELFAGLKRSGQWVDISMSENFMRKYQVLPMRTHPYMNMFNNSVFILTATRVLNTNSSMDTKDMSGIRTGATMASTLRRKKLKLM